MEKNKVDYPIDMVYLWVDGSDPEWQARHDAAVGRTVVRSAVNCEGRYADNDELLYSLRSLELYAPWIRKVFIVTDRQTPRWLDTSNPRVQIVDHTEILPPEARPCFNSRVIEHYLMHIPGLSEHFLYGNDDMLFSRQATPDMFFGPDGEPVMQMCRRPMRRQWLWFKEKVMGKSISAYNRNVHRAAMLVKEKFGTYYGAKMHHNIDAYSKSYNLHVEELFAPEIEAALPNHVRGENDVQRSIYYYTALAEGRGHLKWVDDHDSFRLHIDNRSHYDKLVKADPVLFCMNDSEYATDDDRRHATEWLRQRFPRKSSFEK